MKCQIQFSWKYKKNMALPERLPNIKDSVVLDLLALLSCRKIRSKCFLSKINKTCNRSETRGKSSQDSLIKIA